jgi:GT2 family glycosyltransferase
VPLPELAHALEPLWTAVEDGRRALLDEIGPAPDLTFVRGQGNLGDELIWAGTRRLLEGHVYREILVDDLASARGETVLLSGGGAWCREYHELMPRVLAIAELRFERVIVLPSSFDVEEDRVRDALRRTRATVFAREETSFRRIAPLCRARLAPDCAFLNDLSGYRAAGSGTLNAFRTDRQRSLAKPPDGNDDISVTLPDLETWLATIERHASVRTDRAHVMIAAALMGKEVEYAPVGPLKRALADPLPVRIVERPDEPPVEVADDPRTSATIARIRALARTAPDAGDATRVSALVLSRNRQAEVTAAVRSALASGPLAQVLVVDNNSGPRTRAALDALEAAEPAVRVRHSSRNLGCAGGRRLGLEDVDTEYTLLLDDDAELMPGALEQLVAQLDSHPDALGVTALVVDRDGVVEHFGGWMERSAELVRFTLDGRGRQFDAPELPATGPSGWLPGTAALVRSAAWERFPIDPGMAAYFEDNEWSYRVERAVPGSFRRCREAVVLHRSAEPAEPTATLVKRARAAERLAASARFLARHGIVLEEQLLTHLPELQRPDYPLDVAAARLLLGLLDARGTDWFVAEWSSGGLAPLLDGAHVAAARNREDLAAAYAELERAHEALAAADEWHERLKVRDAEHEQWLARTRAAEAERDRLRAERDTLRVRIEELERRGAADADRIAFLTTRHETLERVEAGGWWRLRTRLLPAIHLARRLRALARRRGR